MSCEVLVMCCACGMLQFTILHTANKHPCVCACVWHGGGEDRHRDEKEVTSSSSLGQE